MIDGDNRGERCLARPQVSRQTLRILVPVIAHEWLDCRPALTSAARSTSAVQRGCIQTTAWGNVTLRYESYPRTIQDGACQGLLGEIRVGE